MTSCSKSAEEYCLAQDYAPKPGRSLPPVTGQVRLWRPHLLVLNRDNLKGHFSISSSCGVLVIASRSHLSHCPSASCPSPPLLTSLLLDMLSAHKSPFYTLLPWGIPPCDTSVAGGKVSWSKHFIKQVGITQQSRRCRHCTTHNPLLWIYSREILMENSH
jgi:hypothetical protein